MDKSFIEVYDNALPDDICDYLVSIFDRENNSDHSTVEEIRTSSDPDTGPTHFASGLHMKLSEEWFHYDSVIGDLDYIVSEKMVDYNNKYLLASNKENFHLIPDEWNLELDENEFDNPSVVSEYLKRMGDYSIKKYTHPDDGYHMWHHDWSALTYIIQRVLAVQFFLNDVEKGGETEFYHQGIKVKPKKGRLAIWPVGFTHTHRGNKPISNDKYVISTWATQKNLFR